MKNVLVVTYYWPPAGGPGVQRSLKFVKYMKEFGWNPLVLTVENNTQLGQDSSLVNDIPDNLAIYKDKILFQPSITTGKSFSDEKSTSSKIKRWVRGNIFIPDSKITWYWLCRESLKKIYREHKIDMCFISGPPQTCHLIGLYIKRRYKTKVVHDFRDPWTDAFFLNDFPRSSISNKIDLALEAKVMRTGDGFVSVNQKILDLVNKKNIDLKSINVENGFDHDISKYKKRKIKTFYYTGSMSDTAIPYKFLRKISKIDVKLIIVGTVHNQLHQFIEKENIQNIEVVATKSHEEIIDIQKQADALLLSIPNVADNEGIITGKIFEYLVSGRPILGIGPVDGEASKILTESGMGVMYDYDDDFSESYDAFLKRNGNQILRILVCFIEQSLQKNFAVF